MDNIKFEKSIEEASYKIVKDMVGKMNKACLLLIRDAKKNAPVDMGILRASIMHQVVVYPNAIIGYVGSNLEYAPYVHQGTGIYALDGNGRKEPWGYMVKAGKYRGYHKTQGQQPNPFLKLAVDANKDKINKMLGD